MRGENAMNNITKPIGVTVLIALFVCFFNFTNLATLANYTALTLLLLLFTLFIHELGHVLFGIGSGYRFNYLTVGPITIENTDRLHIKANESWFFVGGVASCAPLSSNLSSIIKQHKRFVAGGPIFSFAAGVISLILGITMDLKVISYLGACNLIIFIVTILPYKGAIKSDGRVLLELTKGDKHAEEYLLSLLLIKEMNSPLHPTKWSADLIEQAKTLPPTVDNATAGFILFYYTLLKEGYKAASALIEPFKRIPVTKQNKFALQFISHIREIDFIVRGDYEEACIQELHQSLLPIEPFSYKRSEAILAKIRGDQEQAILKLSEVSKEIVKGKKQFGFFYAEEQLTNFLKNELIKEGK